MGFRSPADLALLLTDEQGDFPFRLNSHGFRGPEPDEEPPADPSKRQILFVGDSFLIGYRVREGQLMPAVTESALAAGGSPSRVTSIAGDGYGTGQQLILLRRHLASLADRKLARPDVVMLCFRSASVSRAPGAGLCFACAPRYRCGTTAAAAAAA